MASCAFCFPVFAVSISQAFPYFWSEYIRILSVNSENISHVKH